MVKSSNPKVHDPNNPSTVGNTGSVTGIPEALENVQPSPETADNPNTTPQNVENPNPQPQPPVQPTPSENTKSGKPPIKSITFKSKFLDIKITDPNILEEVNTEGKYATNLPFEALWISINRNGGRHWIKTQDRREVDREIVSGVARKEVESVEFFTTER